MSKIIVVKPGSLLETDKNRLIKEGFVIVEHEQPNELIKQINPDKLVVDFCSNCGEKMFIQKERQDALIRSKNSFYCLMGHGQSYK